MNKTDVIKSSASMADVSIAVATKVVESFFQTIIAGLNSDGKVQITDFGTFTKKKRAARVGRNPSNGKPINIPESTYVSFKDGKGLKDALTD